MADNNTEKTYQIHFGDKTTVTYTKFVHIYIYNLIPFLKATSVEIQHWYEELYYHFISHIITVSHKLCSSFSNAFMS